MLSPSYLFGFCSIVLFLAVESSYNVFTYEDGLGDGEHCCLVQLGNEFCLAKLLTRSLIQVDTDCPRLRPNAKSKNDLSQVVRRLNVESSQKLGDQILIELKDPLDKDILKDDLLCLAPTSNNINLEKCHVVLTPVQAKKTKRKVKKNATETEEPVKEKIEVLQVETSEPIQIQQGQGVAVRQSFQLNVTDIKLSSRQERERWSWYRTQTKKICNQPQKQKITCIPFHRQNEKKLCQILNKTGDASEEQALLSVTKGSKLFCENNRQQTRLLGYYRDSQICFQANHEVYVEHRFTDLVSLSDAKSNRRVLRFISNSSKLVEEFEDDCEDRTTLTDLKKALLQEAKAKTKIDDEAENTVDAEAANDEENPST